MEQTNIIFLLGRKTGVGKTTIMNELLKHNELGLTRIVETTTRSMRDGEVEGEEYHFISEEEFLQKQNNCEFLESRCFDTVKGKWYYGTEKQYISDSSKLYITQGTEQMYKMINENTNINISLIVIWCDDKDRLLRLIERESKNKEPQWKELIRRLYHDEKDSAKPLEAKGALYVYNGDNLEETLNDCINYINKFKETNDFKNTTFEHIIDDIDRRVKNACILYTLLENETDTKPFYVTDIRNILPIGIDIVDIQKDTGSCLITFEIEDSIDSQFLKCLQKRYNIGESKSFSIVYHTFISEPHITLNQTIDYNTLIENTISSIIGIINIKHIPTVDDINILPLNGIKATEVKVYGNDLIILLKNECIYVDKYIRDEYIFENDSIVYHLLFRR